MTIRRGLRNWLLETDSDPSVRFRVLRELLDRPPDRGRDRLARPPPEEGRRVALLPLPHRDAGLLGSPRRFCRAPSRNEDASGPPGHRARRGVLPPTPSVPRRADSLPSLVSAPL